MIATAKACMHCGWSSLSQSALSGSQTLQTVAAPVVPEPRPAPTAEPPKSCPNCGNENIQKVSAVVGHGLYSERGAATVFGGAQSLGGGSPVIGGAVVSTANDGASLVAQWLAPPIVPVPLVSTSHKSAGPLGCATVFIVMMALAPLAKSTGQEQSVGPIMFVIAVVLGIMVTLGFQSKARQEDLALGPQNAAAHHAWSIRNAIWNCLYYCPKCDTVHDPETSRLAPAQSMSSLLVG